MGCLATQNKETRDAAIVAEYLKSNRNSMAVLGRKFDISRERVRQILAKNKIKTRGYTDFSKPRKFRAFHGPVLSHEERFWLNVERVENGCWVWTGKTNSSGYGYFCRNSRTIFAHRFAYELWNKTQLVNWCLHKCDNPPCVNPAHLYDGTPQDNADDRVKRGRGISKL